MPARQENRDSKARPPWPVIFGPTAVGKTAISLAVAPKLNAEIVSVDSRQIYRGMEIGSAAPNPDERARIPHHLIAEVELENGLTAGDYGRRVREVAGEILGRGKIPLLVGGSGLYLRAALGGLDEDLPRNAELRRTLRQRVEREGVEAMYAELEGLDPVTASKLSPRDGQRITRALELILLTGRAASALRTRGGRETIPARIVVLDRERDDLDARIRGRADAMINAGLEDEVRLLLERKLPSDLALLKSVGFVETIEFLNGGYNRKEWLDAIVTNTRRYVKRQRTWFRGIAGARPIFIREGETAEESAFRVAEYFCAGEESGS